MKIYVILVLYPKLRKINENIWKSDRGNLCSKVANLMWKNVTTYDKSQRDYSWPNAGQNCCGILKILFNIPWNGQFITILITLI